MNDTAKLLKECSSGCQTAIDGMSQVLTHISDGTLRTAITTSIDRHTALGERCQSMLSSMGEGKAEPPAMGSRMMRVGTGMKLMMNDDDKKIAEMMADGANMGIVSLSKILNATPTASAESRSLTEEIITEEKQFYNAMLSHL